MDCKRCNKRANFCKPPFGAYFCKNDHLQCAECDLICSYCAVCEEGTKYKSPHFIDEKTTDLKELEKSKFQVPLVRDILPTKEEEAEFQKLRYEYTMGKPRFILGLKADDDVSTVRTLSAIVTKNLYTSKEDIANDEVAESSSHELRLHRIIRTLRETRFSANENEQDCNKKIGKNKQDSEKACCDQSAACSTNLLTPTHSKLGANGKKFLSKINLKIEVSTESDEERDAAGCATAKPPNCSYLKSLLCPFLVQAELKGFPIYIEASSLDRRPFSCPLGNCGCKIFVSELNHHIVLDHPTLPLSPIKVGQFREFSIDIAACENNFAPQSVVCFLLKNIVVNFGALPLKDVIPIFLMVGRYIASDVLDKPKAMNSDTHCIMPWSNNDFFLIWLAGVVPERCQIIASISVFSQENTLSRWYVDQMNSIQAIKNVENTFNSCERLILTYPELKLLTNNFKDMLQCQVGVMECKLQTSK